MDEPSITAAGMAGTAVEGNEVGMVDVGADMGAGKRFDDSVATGDNFGCQAAD